MIETSPNWLSQTSCTAGPRDLNAVVRTHALPLAALLSALLFTLRQLSLLGARGHSGHGSEQLSNPAGGSTLLSPQHLQWLPLLRSDGPRLGPMPTRTHHQCRGMPLPTSQGLLQLHRDHMEETGAGGTRRKAQKVFRGVGG